MKKINNLGQIGPTSLEDLFPMVVAIIITFILIAFVYEIMGGILEQRNIESMHNAAANLMQVLTDKSPYVYEKTPKILDANAIKCSNLEGINLTGYEYGVEIYDLKENTLLMECNNLAPTENAPSIASPVAIRHSEDQINRGLLKITIWRTK